MKSSACSALARLLWLSLRQSSSMKYMTWTFFFSPPQPVTKGQGQGPDNDDVRTSLPFPLSSKPYALQPSLSHSQGRDIDQISENSGMVFSHPGIVLS
jgi:hypothetical protein